MIYNSCPLPAFTHACICIEADLIEGFLGNIVLGCDGCSWTQVLDYEHIAFHCRVCFVHGHLADFCLNARFLLAKRHVNQKTTWWRESGSNCHWAEPSMDCTEPEAVVLVDDPTSPHEGSKKAPFTD